MSIAAALLMLAAASTQPAAKAPPRLPNPVARAAPSPPTHGAVAIAQATAVILRPAVVRLERLEPGDRSWQTGDTFFRQVRREGGHVTVDFD